MNRSLITPTRIHQMRSKPRIVSITGDVGVSQARAKLEPIELIDTPTLPNVQVISSVQMRPERESDSTEVGHTTVYKVKDAEGAPRMPPIIAGLTLHKSTLLGGIKEKEGGVQRTRNSNPTALTGKFELSMMTKHLLKDGLTLQSGQHVVIETEDASTEDLSMTYMSSQGMRVLCLDSAGRTLLDHDYPPAMKEHTIPIPKGTCLVCLSGLGGSQKNFPDLRAGPGEINLHYSTDDTAGAGFHPRTRVVRTPSGYLSRGCMFTTNMIPSITRPWHHADEILRGAQYVDIALPATTEILAVVSSKKEMPTISSNDFTYASRGVSIQGKALQATLWKITPTTKHQGDVLNIELESSQKGVIHSVVGLVGDLKDWSDMFNQRDWSSIVEEGALTAYGESRVILSRSDGTGLEMQEEKAPKEEVRKKKEVIKPKIEEKIKEHLPIFDIGLIDVDTAWKKDISNFAEDDDGDSLKFTLASGPKQMQLSPEGVITFSPTSKDIGSFKAIIQVGDGKSKPVEAIFVGRVVENTSPRWKKEGMK
ncbi:MAG: hypothetical protein ACPHBQ_03195 [Candidatus Poseidoniaceae archaeon]